MKGSVAYHDPCFLGRRNSVYEEPRKILNSIKGLTFSEFRRNRENSFCCGGAERNWVEEKAKDRPSWERIREASQQGFGKIITACPFCLINLEDGIKVLREESAIEIRDIAEVVAEKI